MNTQLADILGGTAEELVGRPVVELVAPEDRERVAAALRRENAVAYEHRALRKDGTTVLVETRARALTFEGRELRVTAVRDVSERARLEAELRRRERLAAIGALVGGVAHEVRTPLFSISATLDALEADARNGEAEQELKALLRSQVSRLSNLMQDLLEYSRPPRLRLATVSPADAVRQAVSHCQRLAEQSDVRILPQLPADLPEVQLDLGRIEQVIENLIANAVQHSPRGASVAVSGVASRAPRAGVLLSVEDDGPGIPESDLDRVFEPFFSRRRGGTGLGLAIAQRFVEAHGGTLSAANRVAARGATFTVFLPDSPQAVSLDA